MAEAGLKDERNDRRKRICFVATVPFAINVFLRGHINVLKEEYDVALVTSGTAEELPGLLSQRVQFIPLHIERKVSLGKDLLAFARLWRLFRTQKYDSVHSIMPKSGLLSMTAARLAGVRLRIHTFTGQVWTTRTGLPRLILKSFDKVLAANATQIFADSRSQREFLIQKNVVKETGINVLAEGSIVGVNLKRFKFDENEREKLRLEYKISKEAVTFIFVGRLKRDKGLLDLSRAFAMAAKQNGNIHLLIVGADEDGLENVFSMLAKEIPGRVHRAGFADRPQAYLSAADVFCLPSYREGFGSVLIEAAAVGLPAIASRIYGITDAVDDGVTGILHRPSAVDEIAKAMLLLASNGDLRSRMGEAARVRTIEKFPEERVTRALLEFYQTAFSKIDSAGV